MPAYHSFVAGVVGRPEMETTRAARRLESLPAWLFEQPLRALLVDTCASLSELPSAFQHCATLRILDCASTPLGLEMETGYSLELIEGMESRFLPLHAIAPGLRIRIEDTDQYTNNLEAVGFVGGWWDPGVFDLRRHLEAQEQAQREFEEAKAAAAALPQPPPVCPTCKHRHYPGYACETCGHIGGNRGELVWPKPAPKPAGGGVHHLLPVVQLDDAGEPT